MPQLSLLGNNTQYTPLLPMHIHKHIMKLIKIYRHDI